MAYLLWFAKFFAISPAQGAETIVYLASSPDVATTTGQYYYKCVLPLCRGWRGTTDRLCCCGARGAVLAGTKENGA